MDSETSPGRDPDRGPPPDLRARSGRRTVAIVAALAVVLAAAAVVVVVLRRGPHPASSAARAAAQQTPAVVPSAATTTASATPSAAPTPAAAASPFVTATPTPHATTASPTPPPAPSSRVVHDSTGAISVLVPASWTSLGEGWHPPNLPPYPNGTDIGPGLNASTNLQAWFNDLTTPGLFVGASHSLIGAGYTPDTLLQHIGFPGCSLFSSQPYATGPWTGTLDVETCANSATRIWNIAMWPASHGYILCLQAKIVTPADRVAADRALASLSVSY